MDPGKAAHFAEPLPNDRWPVIAKSLLTRRERELYDALNALYPEYRLFVQVALSQLVDVPRTHPERHLIRSRFSQLVADFVLCRSDLSIIAVIELDDRSHDHPIRQAADARKNKALKDAGLRLVRIRKGPLPSAGALRAILAEASRSPEERGTTTEPRPDFGGSDIGTAEDPATRRTVDPLKVSANRAAWQSTEVFGITTAALGVFLMVIWLAHVSIPAHEVRTVSRAPAAIPALRTQVQPVQPRPTRQELEERRDAEIKSVADLQRLKDRAWATFYVGQVSCEHPADWSAQVECGNQYIRAKRAFETQWAQAH